ncbi:MAG TPA: hypothetical protein DHN29_09625 [Cytophagales bacterium]|nr:hypothetical protein [Cytophagales bacterium]|tara:strand:+ start:144 stop:1100 length:957 start_codon:yes stop_codon:yes gene_type:complete
MEVKYILFVLLLIPLATAVSDLDVDVSKNLIKISGSCDKINLPVSMQASDGISVVWIKEVKTGTDKKFAAQFVPPVQKLTVLVACSGETPISTPVDTSYVAPAPSGSTGGGGGGGGCNPSWSCGAWSFCNKDLQQTRVCTDSKNCKTVRNKPNETQSCLECEESWICNNVKNCDDGKSYCTSVIDEHACGTTKSKPAPKAQCVDGTKGYVAPPSSKPPTVPPTTQIPAPSFWEQYMLWIILIPSLIILIIIVVLLILHFRKPHVVYNLNELEDWIKLERNAGTSDQDIRQILHDQTGWEEKDINQAFGELGTQNVKKE